MAKLKKAGKHVEKARKLVEPRPYKLSDASELIKKTHHTKFNETVELAINLGVDPKHSDQVVRGTVVLPHGLGKSVRVLVLASGEKQREAQEAGADFVGGDEMVQKIMEGWTDYDAVIATPDMMKSAGKLGKVLGPRGLMPNPKTGTVTADVTKAIKETKAGKVEFRVDKAGIVHCPVGKIKFEAVNIAEKCSRRHHRCRQSEAGRGERQVRQENYAHFHHGPRYRDRPGGSGDRRRGRGIGN